MSKPRETPQGVMLKLKVRPRAGRLGLQREGDELVLEVRAAPVKGAANRQIVEFLEELFGHPVEIVQGHRRRHKLVLIRGARLEEVVSRIDEP